MSLAPFVHAMGRGPSKGRNLTRDEAHAAMDSILSGEAAPEAVGALLMLMRYRGETAEEVAGFVSAMRERVEGWQGMDTDLDWPSYAAGRSRGLPWFLLSAKLVAAGGARVLLHGWNSHQAAVADVRSALASVEIPICQDPAAADQALSDGGIAYVPVEALNQGFLDLLKLREVLGLRSAVNTCLRVLNPTGAASTVQGVFHPPYRNLQQDAGALLGQENLLVLKGGGGEFERHPGKSVELYGLSKGVPVETIARPLVAETRRLADEDPDPANLAGLWSGRYDDPFATAIVLGTAAAALWSLGRAESLDQAQELAVRLWEERS